MVVGTAGYMSPEQVRGEPVDARSDIFSFGAILYEMLTGRPAFTRETAAETMTAILKEDPPEPLAADVPPALARIVSRCLEKTRETRFQSARDLAFGLEMLSDTAATSGAGLTAGCRTLFVRWRLSTLVWVVAGALAIGLAGTIAWNLNDPAPPLPVVTNSRSSLPMPVNCPPGTVPATLCPLTGQRATRVHGALASTSDRCPSST